MKNFQGKKKRIFSALLATIVAAGMLSACGSGGGSSTNSSASAKSGGSTIAAVKDMGNGVKQVTVAVLDGMAPYTYTDDNGKLQGYDYEWM